MRSILISLLIFSTALPAAGIGVFDEPTPCQEQVTGAIPTPEKKVKEVTKNRAPPPQKVYATQPEPQQQAVPCEPATIYCAPKKKHNFWFPAALFAGGVTTLACYTIPHGCSSGTDPGTDPIPVDANVQFRLTSFDGIGSTYTVTLSGPDASLPISLGFSITGQGDTLLIPTVPLLNPPSGTYTIAVDTTLNTEVAFTAELLINGVVSQGPTGFAGSPIQITNFSY